jgi:hypothetical protein
VLGISIARIWHIQEILAFTYDWLERQKRYSVSRKVFGGGGLGETGRQRTVTIPHAAPPKVVSGTSWVIATTIECDRCCANVA